MAILTEEQRARLRNKILQDLVDSANGDTSYLSSVFSQGVKGVDYMSDDDLLQAHKESFDSDFLEQEQED